jgi:hypothetical protein
MSKKPHFELLVAVLTDSLSESQQAEAKSLRGDLEFEQQLDYYRKMLQAAGALVTLEQGAKQQPAANQPTTEQLHAMAQRLKPKLHERLRLLKIIDRILTDSALDPKVQIRLEEVAANASAARILDLNLRISNDDSEEEQVVEGAGGLIARRFSKQPLRIKVPQSAEGQPALVLMVKRDDLLGPSTHSPDLTLPHLVGPGEFVVINQIEAGDYEVLAIIGCEPNIIPDVNLEDPDDDQGPRSKAAVWLDRLCFGVLDANGQIEKTGFFITEDGYALTAHLEAWRRGSSVKIRYHGQAYTAEVIQTDSTHDVVLLHVKGVLLKERLPMSEGILLDQQVVVGGYSHQSRARELQAIRYRTHQDRALYQVQFQDKQPRKCLALLPDRSDARVSPGSSGGPILAIDLNDEPSHLIGVVLAGSAPAMAQLQGNVMVRIQDTPYDWAMPLKGLFPDWPEFKTLLRNSELKTAAAATKMRSEMLTRRFWLTALLGIVVLLGVVTYSFLPRKTFAILRRGENQFLARYSTLAQAIEHAENGAVIEVGGNGPYSVEPLTIRGKSLTIRAASGVRPVFELKPEFLTSEQPLIDADESLVLEGLELRRVGKAGDKAGNPLLMYLIKCEKASFYAAHCTFVLSPGADCVHSSGSPECVFTGCVFQGGHALSWHPPAGGRLLMENCLQIGGSAVHLHYDKPDLNDVKITLANNTLIGIGERGESLKLFVSGDPINHLKQGRPNAIRITARGNVFDADQSILKVTKVAKEGGPLKGAETAQVLELLAKVISWDDKQNVYRAKIFLDGWGAPLGRNFSDWNDVWKIAGSQSVEAAPTYSGFSRASSPDLSIPLTASALQLDRLVTPTGDMALQPGIGAPVKIIGAASAEAEWQEHPERHQRWLRLCREQPLAGIRIATVVAPENAWYDDYAVSQALTALGAKTTTLSTQTGERTSQKKGEVPQPNITVDQTIKTAEKQQSEPTQRFDVALICGGSGRRDLLDQAKPDLVSFLTKLKEQGGYLVALGDGVEVLAELELLRDTQVTTHLKNKSVIEKYGAILVMKDDANPSDFLRSGHVLTAKSAEFQAKLIDGLTAAIRERDFQ